jgi:hypothetical protein
MTGVMPNAVGPNLVRDGDGLEGVMAPWDLVPWFHKGLSDDAGSVAGASYQQLTQRRGRLLLPCASA